VAKRETSQWLVARESSDENLFSIVKFRGQAELAKAHLTAVK